MIHIWVTCLALKRVISYKSLIIIIKGKSKFNRLSKFACCLWGLHLGIALNLPKYVHFFILYACCLSKICLLYRAKFPHSGNLMLPGSIFLLWKIVFLKPIGLGKDKNVLFNVTSKNLPAWCILCKKNIWCMCYFFREKYSSCILIVLFLSNFCNDGWDWAIVNVNNINQSKIGAFYLSLCFMVRQEPSQKQWAKSNQQASQKHAVSCWEHGRYKQTLKHMFNVSDK